MGLDLNARGSTPGGGHDKTKNNGRRPQVGGNRAAATHRVQGWDLKGGLGGNRGEVEVSAVLSGWLRRKCAACASTDAAIWGVTCPHNRSINQWCILLWNRGGLHRRAAAPLLFHAVAAAGAVAAVAAAAAAGACQGSVRAGRGVQEAGQLQREPSRVAVVCGHGRRVCGGRGGRDSRGEALQRGVKLTRKPVCSPSVNGLLPGYPAHSLPRCPPAHCSSCQSSATALPGLPQEWAWEHSVTRSRGAWCAPAAPRWGLRCRWLCSMPCIFCTWEQRSQWEVPWVDERADGGDGRASSRAGESRVGPPPPHTHTPTHPTPPPPPPIHPHPHPHAHPPTHPTHPHPPPHHHHHHHPHTHTTTTTTTPPTHTTTTPPQLRPAPLSTPAGAPADASAQLPRPRWCRLVAAGQLPASVTLTAAAG